jgi:hypothetical protein
MLCAVPCAAIAVCRSSPNTTQSQGCDPFSPGFAQPRALHRIDFGGLAMKIVVAGSMLVLAFLITGNSFADPGPCTKDFWGNCETSRHHSRYHHGHRHSHCVRDYWGRCGDGRPRWRHRHHHHHHGHAHHHPRGELDRGIICQPRRRVVGEERKSEERAKKSAESAWMGAVRYDYGERYQDLSHAKDPRFNCDPSSVSRIVKTPYYRCVVEATPCRAPTGSTESRVERRFEVESDED